MRVRRTGKGSIERQLCFGPKGQRAWARGVFPLPLALWPLGPLALQSKCVDIYPVYRLQHRQRNKSNDCSENQNQRRLDDGDECAQCAAHFDVVGIGHAQTELIEPAAFFANRDQLSG